MSDHVPASEAPQADWASALTRLADLLARQRQAIEARDFDQMDTLTAHLEHLYGDIEAMAASGELMQLWQRASPQDREAVTDVVRQANLDNRVSGELIRVALHRLAVLRAASTADNQGATYRPDGSAPQAGSRLSRRA